MDGSSNFSIYVLAQNSNSLAEIIRQAVAVFAQEIKID
jgi:hypothetical protein